MFWYVDHTVMQQCSLPVYVFFTLSEGLMIVWGDVCVTLPPFVYTVLLFLPAIVVFFPFACALFTNTSVFVVVGGGCGARYADLAHYMLKCRVFRQGRDRVAGTLREIWGNERWGQ